MAPHSTEQLRPFRAQRRERRLPVRIAVAEDDVVEEGDADDVSGFDEAAGEGETPTDILRIPPPEVRLVDGNVRGVQFREHFAESRAIKT